MDDFDSNSKLPDFNLRLLPVIEAPHLKARAFPPISSSALSRRDTTGQGGDAAVSLRPLGNVSAFAKPRYLSVFGSRPKGKLQH